VELIDKMTARRERVQRALDSQLDWRADVAARLTAADERIAAHRAELKHLDGLIAGLRYMPANQDK
jgi:hypothetical protein